MHGGLLEMESKRLEGYLPIIDRSLALSAGRDATSPENIAQLCLECVEDVDRELPGTASTVDLLWAPSLMLTAAEVEFGIRLSCAFLREAKSQWLEVLRVYLGAMMPDIEELFTVGFLGW